VEAARVLGVGVGTVKSMHRQALARLRAVAPDLGQLIGVDHD
jgi:DNA-directed RNA polymerase specialized sigma24 family protein